MIKRITNILAVIVLAINANAMTAVNDKPIADTVSVLSARTCLSVAPDNVFPYIEKNVRLDMIDYFDAGSNKPSQNLYGGNCRIVNERDSLENTSLITVQMADSATVQFFVLNANSLRPIIGVIETVPTPIPDSSIKFYDSKWNELSGIFKMPSISEWIKPENKKQRSDLEASLPFIISSCSYNPESKTITVSNNMKDYYSEGEKVKDLEALRQSIIYQWTGKEFKAVKK